MKKMSEWWKRDKRYVTFAKAVLLALLPVLCCGVKCAVDGRSVREVWLPGSLWNDELFYFKQVESILEYGYPMGYYGFNESHALKLSFAAWSPVLVFPWILWGLFFGWNLLSPILCNIAVLSFVFFMFVCLVNPTWKQTGLIAMLLCLYTPMWRYALSSMPEAICMAMTILFYALAWNYLNRRTTVKLAALFVISAVMTLMRPYMLLFMFLPAYLWIREKRWIGLIGSGACMVMVFGIYAGIHHYLGAAYFTPLFFTDWLEAYISKGFFDGVYTTFGKLYRMGREFLAYSVEGYRSGLYAGTYFSVFTVMLLILIYQCLRQYILKKNKIGDETGNGQAIVVQGHLLFSFVAMLFAVLLMYKLTEGSRHLLTFMAAAIFVIGMMDTRYFKKPVLLGVALAYFLNYKATDPIVYRIPYVQENEKKQLEYWQNVFDAELQLSTEGAPDFKNNIIWVTTDRNEDGQVESVLWQMLYEVPEGFGISCCQPEYCEENLELLQSHYIATLTGGRLDLLLRDGGYFCIGRDEKLVVYDLYRTDK